MRVAREALPFAVVPALLVALAALLLPPWTAVVPALLFVYILWFFRDPERRTPDEAGVLICPADGRILEAGPERISVFLNIFNVHVCRSPLGGTVRSVQHSAGRFLAAFKPAAPEQNERTEIELEGRDGRLRFTLVAGLVARRIVCKVAVGQALHPGERIGLIRFGSRVDVYPPAGSAVAVRRGEKVVAGETIIARLRREDLPGRS